MSKLRKLKRSKLSNLWARTTKGAAHLYTSAAHRHAAIREGTGLFLIQCGPLSCADQNDDRSPLNFGSDVSAGTFCWITRAEHTTCRLIVRTLENT
jgi:hypothetical protein